jgi:hydroxymethylpyrimidine/phosphomethylpyrimidine kinase
VNPRSLFEDRPVALTIAGSDSGGGAGIQADLRAFWALGCFGASAITCVTAQNLNEVTRVEALPPKGVTAQVDAVADGFKVRAVKTGMLYSRAIIEAVNEACERRFGNVPLVVDPVMVATSGARLLRDDAVRAYEALFQRATVITPNLDELAVLIGERPEKADQLEGAARKLVEHFGCAVLAKGGHLEGPAIDVLVTKSDTHRWSGPRVENVNTHGSGCSFASAIAAGLAHGFELPEAVERAKAWLASALEHPVSVQSGSGSVQLLGGATSPPATV